MAIDEKYVFRNYGRMPIENVCFVRVNTFAHDCKLRFVRLQKLTLEFSSSWFVIRVIPYPYPSLYLMAGLFLSLWCFSILVVVVLPSFIWYSKFQSEVLF